VGEDPRDEPEHLNHVPGDKKGWLDAKKKTISAKEQDPVARKAWWEQLEGMDREKLVFIDETSTNTAMTRRYARAPRGERAVGSAPRNYDSSSLVCALSLEGIGEAMVVEGAIDGAAFEVYLNKLLCPSLKPGQVVVLDNLSVHKGKKVGKLIEAVGCSVRYLPPYSPDYSPIEPCFSKVKEALRAAEARTDDELLDAIGEALQEVTSSDASGWFAHCGYQPACPN
jgi:transposase